MGRKVLWLAVIASCIGCDQGTKRIAEHALKDRPPLSFLHGSAQLLYAENTGAFGSLGAGWPHALKQLVFVLIPLAVLIGLAVSLMRTASQDSVKWLAASLVIGGGLGNIVDRIADGYVVDFILLRAGPLATNVFNVADVAVMAGVLLLLIRRPMPNASPA